jgi:hypothetical protein
VTPANSLANATIAVPVTITTCSCHMATRSADSSSAAPTSAAAQAVSPSPSSSIDASWGRAIVRPAINAPAQKRKASERAFTGEWNSSGRSLNRP